MNDKHVRLLMSALDFANASQEQGGIAGMMGRPIVGGAQNPNGLILDSSGRPLDVDHSGRLLAPEIRPLRGVDPRSRGSSIQLAYGDPFKTFATMQSQGDDAERITATIGVQPIGFNAPTIGGQSQELQGRLTWGVGGASYTALFDVGMGTSFSFIASYAKLDIQYLTGNPGPAVLQVSGGFGYGNVAYHPNALQLTVKLGLIPQNGKALVAIPPFATSFDITSLGSNYPTDNLVIDVGGTPQTLSKYHYTTPTNQGRQAGGSFPIPSGANFVSVTQQQPLQDYVTIIFNLTL